MHAYTQTCNCTGKGKHPFIRNSEGFAIGFQLKALSNEEWMMVHMSKFHARFVSSDQSVPNIPTPHEAILGNHVTAIFVKEWNLFSTPGLVMPRPESEAAGLGQLSCVGFVIIRASEPACDDFTAQQHRQLQRA
jgi:hypothetical protein